MIATRILAAMAVLAMAGGAASSAPAQTPPAHPDLDGAWVLNVARSDYGDFPGPNAETLKIHSAAGYVRLDIAQTVRRSTRTYALDLPLDGTEVRYPLSADIRVGATILRSAAAAWRGDALVIIETVQHMQEMTVLETIYTRGSDGRSLRLETVPKGEAVQSALVFERVGE